MGIIKTRLQIATLLMLASYALISQSCVTSQTKNIKGPFLEEELVKRHLLQTQYHDETIIRIIYPPFAEKEEYKTLLDDFIDNNEDIRAFFPLGKEKFTYKLGIYMYQYANTKNILSAVIECEFKYPDQAPFTIWYTFNYDKQTQSRMEYRDIFIGINEVLPIIASYIQQDVRRQKKQRDVDASNDLYLSMDTSLLVGLINDFALVSSEHSKNKISAIQVILNNFGTEEDSTYTVNVPTSVFQDYLRTSMKGNFINEEVPLISQPPVINRLNTFPQITPFF